MLSQLALVLTLGDKGDGCFPDTVLLAMQGSDFTFPANVASHRKLNILEDPLPLPFIPGLGCRCSCQREFGV
jgi:hypothetical protein